MTAATPTIAAGSVVIAGAGRRLTLGKLIKSGGAGSVFRVVDDPAVVAKIYHPEQRAGDYQHRISAMLAMKPELPDIDEGGRRHVQLAWPLALLHEPRGDFLGFLMPAVDVDATSELEMILQEKQARAAGLPTGLGAKVTLAANLAAVIAALHRQQHHVVDMKPVNLRFYPRSLYMAMLDCDGFGIRGENRRFAAPQFTPEYLAPEFQHGGLTPAGEEVQDRFALAVIVFQLLNFGLHPFSGRPLHDRVATDIPGRIAQRVYGYGVKPSQVLAPSPVSGHVLMPAQLRRLFDRAFAGESERPSAAEWAIVLREFAQRAQGRLVLCASDREHQHFSGMGCASCARTALIAETRHRAGEAQAAAALRVDAALPAALAAAQRRRALANPPPAAVPGQPPPAGGGRGKRKRAKQAAAQARAQAAGPGAGPAPRRPPLRPPRPPASPPLSAGGKSRLKAALLIFAAILAVMILVVINVMPRNRAPAAASPSPPPSPPAAVDASPRLKELSRPALSNGRVIAPYIRAETRERINRAIAAVLNADDVAYLQAQTWLRQQRNGLKRAPAGSADDLRGVADYAQIRAVDDLAATQQSVAERAWQQRDDPHLAFEAGWLALLGGRPIEAENWFKHALEIAADRPGPWLGLALLARDDGAMTGALVIAESLAPDTATAAGNRDASAALLSSLRIDPRRWAILVARARRLQADRNGEALPADVRALADQALPNR